MSELGHERGRIDLGPRLFRFRSGMLYELLQVIRVLKLIEGWELFVEPLQRYRLGVVSRRWLVQSLDFSRRHIPASGDVGSEGTSCLDDTRVAG